MCGAAQDTVPPGMRELRSRLQDGIAACGAPIGRCTYEKRIHRVTDRLPQPVSLPWPAAVGRGRKGFGCKTRPPSAPAPARTHICPGPPLPRVLLRSPHLRSSSFSFSMSAMDLRTTGPPSGASALGPAREGACRQAAGLQECVQRETEHAWAQQKWLQSEPGAPACLPTEKQCHRH